MATLVFLPVFWAAPAFFGYAMLVDRGSVPTTFKIMVGVMTALALSFTIFGGGKTGRMPAYGMLDLVRWFRERRTRGRREAGCCVHCGYPMSGHGAPTCPECGRSLH